ncbi:uncharacterized protein LOC124648927 [Lolium rigidum]|uniref:uncharacterized protein LOC124648927 n=1 Tax=Lolium rigidum TaxID=89674 RepID=UPI001F5C589B|nr:uncharacterized protein LOC124648927 [Lolium rigidum]XP_047044566.1 uncharacterized protein LOC124648927 [Lolium rigidum]XP_047044567.1 uncharacterized protein LOC124648927 [Lolium rigidum]
MSCSFLSLPVSKPFSGILMQQHEEEVSNRVQQRPRIAHTENQRRQEAPVVWASVRFLAPADAACCTAASGTGGGQESARLLFFQGCDIGVCEAFVPLRPGVLPQGSPTVGHASRRRGVNAEEELKLFGRWRLSLCGSACSEQAFGGAGMAGGDQKGEVDDGRDGVLMRWFVLDELAARRWRRGVDRVYYKLQGISNPVENHLRGADGDGALLGWWRPLQGAAHRSPPPLDVAIVRPSCRRCACRA